MKLKFLLIISLFYLAACSTVTDKTIQSKSMSFENNSAIYFFDNKLAVIFSINSFTDLTDSTSNFIRSIISVDYRIKVKGNSDEKIGNLKILKKSGRKSRYDYFIAYDAVKIPDGFKAKEDSIEFVIKTNNDIYTFSQTLADSIPPLVLIPFIETIEIGSVQLGACAIRLSNTEKEYLSTGEMFRCVIVNKKNGILWSSDFESNQLQVVTKVLPEEPGDYFIYTTDFNGIKNSGNDLSMGFYDFIFGIPSKPKPYSTRINVYWKK
ncbi:MAG: BsuPI protein [Ignavibacteria bacterium]|nr:BsuPI protein [Ignavibacteria bacterium]